MTRALCSTNSAMRCTDAIERDISLACRHHRCRRLRRVAFAALRALVGSTGDTARSTRVTAAPVSRCPRRCLSACSRPGPSIKASRLWNTRRALSSISTCIHCLMLPGSTSPFRTQGPRPHRHAGEIVMRHRLPHFQHLFSGGGYAAGLLLHVVGSARCRCV